MKPTSFLAAAALASASSVVPRDSMPFQQVLNSITANITNLDVQVNAYTSDKSSVDKALSSLLAAMTDGTKTINAQPNLSAADTAGLVDPLQTLNDDSMKLNSDLKSKRSTVEKNSACGDVRTGLDSLNTAASDLIKAAVSKVPKGFQSIAQSSTQNFTDTFQQTRDYFSDANCKNGASSGNSTASGTGASQTTGGAGSATTSSASPTKTNAAAGADMQMAGAFAVAMAAFLV